MQKQQSLWIMLEMNISTTHSSLKEKCYITNIYSANALYMNFNFPDHDINKQAWIQDSVVQDQDLIGKTKTKTQMLKTKTKVKAKSNMTQQ